MRGFSNFYGTKNSNFEETENRPRLRFWGVEFVILCNFLPIAGKVKHK